MAAERPTWATDIVVGVHARIQPKKGRGLNPASGIVVVTESQSFWMVADQPTPMRWLEMRWQDVGDVKLSQAPPSVVRTYKGKDPTSIGRTVQEEARLLSYAGYSAGTQVWTPGQYRGVDFVAAVLLMIFLVGFLILFYMLIVKPDGTLSVTYAKGMTPRVEAPQAETRPPASSLVSRLHELEEAKSAGLITDEEYATRRARILAS